MPVSKLLPDAFDGSPGRSMIDQEELDTGTITALMIRFKDYRLPRAKRLLERVNRGELLTDDDIAFLKRVYRDGWQVQPLVKRHPEYSRLVALTMDLYTEIINKGVQNEAAARGTGAESGGTGARE
jgi:hypothetical protein